MRSLISVLIVLFLHTNLFATTPNKNTVIFYYGWFPGNWDKQNAQTGKINASTQITTGNQCAAVTGTHTHNTQTPNDSAATYWPVLGRYATSNVLVTHRANITTAGMKSAALSYGQNGQPNLTLIQTIYNNLTSSSAIRVSFAIRNYKQDPGGGGIQRTKDTVKVDIAELRTKTGGATGKQYRVKFNNYMAQQRGEGSAFRLVYYIFAPDDPQGGCGPGGGDDGWGDWGCIFTATNRGWQPEPFIVFGQNAANTTNVKMNGFDGGYDYSPPTQHNAAFFDGKSDDAWLGTNNWMYSAGVAPGYNVKRSKDEPLNCRGRNPNGYSTELNNARIAGPHLINVISFNEWNEGTQIEPAQTNGFAMSGVYVNNSMTFCGNPVDCGFQYLGYQGAGSYSTGPNIYLQVTQDFIGDSTDWNPRNPVDVLNN